MSTPAKVITPAVDYKADFYSWTLQQAELMRSRRLDQLDLKNLAEELDDLGASLRRELRSRLTVLLQHLLKWQYQPERRSSSWRSTIVNQRGEIELLLEDNPGLKPLIDERLAKAYRAARERAADETEQAISIYPIDCLWTFEQVTDRTFWPE